MPSAIARLDFRGADKLRKRLAKLKLEDSRTLRKISRKAGNKASKPIVKTARALTPQRFGLLRIAWGHVTRTYVRSGVVAVVIGARTNIKGKKVEVIRGGGELQKIAKPHKYAHLVEFGTKPHEMTTLVPGPNGPKLVTFTHPGATGQHILQRAYESNKTKAFNQFSEVLDEELRKLSR